MNEINMLEIECDFSYLLGNQLGCLKVEDLDLTYLCGM